MNENLRILVVDDDHNMARTLADILRVKGYRAEVAHSGPEALDQVRQTAFDCVLSDVKMPEIDGVALYRAIKSKRPHLPVLLMTAYSADTLVKQGLEEGVIGVLNKPLDIGQLLSFLDFLHKERSVVIVDDDANFCRTLGDILRVRGFAVSQITNPHQVMEQLVLDRGAVLLDMKLNSVGGLEILKRIRAQHPQLPVVLVTAYRKEMAGAIAAALELGAYTCLYKPLEIEKLLALLSHIHHEELGVALEQGG